SAKCRKNNSSRRHHTSRRQGDLTLRCAIASRCFYVYGECWSFHTAKTQSGHRPDRNPAVQQSAATRDLVSSQSSTGGARRAPPRFRTFQVCPKDLPSFLRQAERAANRARGR